MCLVHWDQGTKMRGCCTHGWLHMLKWGIAYTKSMNLPISCTVFVTLQRWGGACPSAISKNCPNAVLVSTTTGLSGSTRISARWMINEGPWIIGKVTPLRAEIVLCVFDHRVPVCIGAHHMFFSWVSVCTSSRAVPGLKCQARDDIIAATFSELEPGIFWNCDGRENRYQSFP